jgi:hypothetical protein
VKINPKTYSEWHGRLLNYIIFFGKMYSNPEPLIF